MTWCKRLKFFIMKDMGLVTHWGRVTHICVSKLIIIGSDNGLSPGRRQAIIWTNAGILLIGPLGTNFSEISSKIHIFSFNKMHLKKSSGIWQPFCLGLNMLMMNSQCHGCWSSGNAKSQDINSNGINLVSRNSLSTAPEWLCWLHGCQLDQLQASWGSSKHNRNMLLSINVLWFSMHFIQ